MRFLDTDVLVDVIRGYQPALAWLTSLHSDEFQIPGFVVLELIQGARNRREMIRLLTTVRTLPVYWPTVAESEHAVDLCSQYILSHNLDPFDALIAASVLGQRGMLCTFNVRHFRAIPNLMLEQPYSR
jgi:predicted nucleic acid-binding protein